MPGVVADTINRTPAITASTGLATATHESVQIFDGPPEDGTYCATTWGPAARMRRWRSEHSATGKTERGRIELRSHALRMTQPHVGEPAYGKRAAMQAVGDLRRREEDAWGIHWRYLINQIT